MQTWNAGAVYARVQPLSFLYLAARGDAFREHVPTSEAGTASSLFYGADVYSLTGTIDVRPIERISIRGEYRHDIADADIYFRRHVDVDPTTKAAVPNAETQDTITVGMTGWF